MKRIKGILVLVLLLALLASPIAVLASDISGANYYGVIVVTSNSSSAVSNVAVNCTLSTQNLIDIGYLNSSANNCAVRSSAGVDLAFGPSVNASYPWCIWVPSLGPNASTGDILYTAESKGGKTRYFPTSTGMDTVDSGTLELGGNFTVEQNAWWNTTYTTDNTTVDPTGHHDPDQEWTNEAQAYNNNPANFATDGIVQGNWGAFLELTIGDNSTGEWCNGARYLLIDTDAGRITQYDIDIYDGAWQHGNTGAIAAGNWHNISFGASYFATQGRIRFYCQPGPNGDARPAGFDFTLVSGRQISVNKPSAFETYLSATENITSIMVGTGKSVTASGVTTGEHSVITTANTSHMWIIVDGVTKDTVALAGETVADNGNDWTFFSYALTRYAGADNITLQRIWVGGVLQQDIEWELDTTFTDLSGNSHDATPTFRENSSNAAVSAVFTSFQPIVEAKAPSYVLTGAPPFIEDTAPIVDVWGMTPPAGTFPLAGVIVVLANATDTPAQLPLLIIAAFVIIGLSLATSGLMRQYGSGSVFVKVLVVVSLMGVFLAIGNFGMSFWMVVVFLIMGFTICVASRHTTWT